MSDPSMSGNDEVPVDAVGPAALERSSVPLIGVIAQSVGTMGVSGVVALVVPLVGATSGTGNWVTWTLCTAVILMVAWCIAQLARRFATSGGVYGLAAKTLGSFGGVTVGWTMLVLVGALQGAVVIGFGVYASQFLTLFGIPANRATLAVAAVVGLGVAWVASLGGMRESVKVMLGLEVVTVVSIAFLMFAILLTHHGTIFDASQLQLRHATFHNVILGVVLAVLAFGGFESATVLGAEAKDPNRAIPTAMITTVCCAGVFWIFCGYVIFLGFEHTHFNLATSTAPLSNLSEAAGIAPFRYVVNLMIALTLLGSLIAVFNSVTRFMYSMARDGLGIPSWKKLSEKRKSPIVAIHWLGGIWAAIVVVVIASGIGPFTVIEDAGDVSGYAFMLIYALVAIGTLRYLRRERSLRTVDAAFGVLAVASMGYVFYGTVTPFPPAFPDDVILYVFLGAVAAIAGGYVYLRTRRKDVLERVGNSVDEDTATSLAATSVA